MKFSYTEVIAPPNCNGTINLFWGEHPIAWINNIEIANQIKSAIPEKNNQEIQSDPNITVINEHGNIESGPDITGIKRD